MKVLKVFALFIHLLNCLICLINLLFFSSNLLEAEYIDPTCTPGREAVQVVSHFNIIYHSTTVLFALLQGDVQSYFQPVLIICLILVFDSPVPVTPLRILSLTQLHSYFLTHSSVIIDERKRARSRDYMYAVRNKLRTF